MRRATWLILFGLIAPGCITAPIGFYESAFPEDRRWSMGTGVEMVRMYSGTEDPENPTYSEGAALRLMFGYAPIPELTLGTMIYNQGFALKIKGALVSGDIWALALISLVGVSSVEEQVVVSATSGAIFSLGTPRYAGEDSWQFAFNLGPKVVTAWTQYDNEAAATAPVHWEGALVDAGGFVGISIERGGLDLSLEFTMLAAERPGGERELSMFGGVFVDGHWSLYGD